MNNKKIKVILTFAILVVGFFAFLNAKAAQVEVQPGFYDQYKDYLKNMPAPTALNGGASSALERAVPFYKAPFTIFKVTIDSDNRSFSPGDEINLKGNLDYEYKGDENISKIKTACMNQLKDANKCTMPSVYKMPEAKDLGVYVQVWRKDEDKAGALKGDFLADEFYSLENQDLKIGEKKGFSIKWTVPQDQPGGSYYLMVYVNQNHSFDLVGTPLVAFSDAERFDFEIKSDKKSGLQIDKNNLKINGENYVYRKPAPTVENEEVKIEIPLQNLGSNLEQAQVKYDLYRWGRINPKDLINSKTENKTIAPSANETLTYNFTPDNTDSVYDLKVSVKGSASKTTAYLRFVINGKERGIFRYLSFVDYSGKLAPLFCARNANWSGSFDGKIRLTLGDQKFEQEGTLNAEEGNCYIAKNLTASSNCSRLKGEVLDKDGKVVDEKETSVNCGENGQNNSAATNKNTVSSDKNYLLLLVIALVVVLAGGIIIKKLRIKNKDNEKNSLK